MTYRYILRRKPIASRAFYEFGNNGIITEETFKTALTFETYKWELNLFWFKAVFSFLDNEPLLKGVFCEFKLKINAQKIYYLESIPHSLVGIDSENQNLELSYKVLNCIANGSISELLDVCRRLDLYHDLNFDFASAEIFQHFVQPFAEYFLEAIDQKSAVLSFVLRYKHRSEWFFQNNLQRIIQIEMERKESGESKHASVEDRLAIDLYSFLYDEGINFFISPSSINGRIDLIGEGKRPLLEGQTDSSHRLLADAKVFDGKSRGESYIGKGFGQIVDYCKKYNENFGYLVIYNISDKSLEFDLPTTINGIPTFNYFGTTIIFIVIDLKEKTSSSKSGKPSFVRIDQKHLVSEVAS